MNNNRIGNTKLIIIISFILAAYPFYGLIFTNMRTATATAAAASSASAAVNVNAEAAQAFPSHGSIRISLPHAIERALSNQGLILKAKHIIAEKMDLKKAAYAGLMPDIAINGGGIWTRTKNGYPVFASANGMRELIGEADLTVPIFDPKSYAAISLAANSLKSAKYRLRLARLFVAARVTQDFYGLILLKDELKIKQKALDNAKKILTAAKIEYKAGNLPRFDIVQTELMAVKLRTDSEVLKSEVKSLERVFLMDIFYNYNNVRDAKLSPLSPARTVHSSGYRIPPLNRLILNAVKKQPLIQIARSEIKSARAYVSFNKAGRLPSIRGGAAYGEDTVNSFDAPNIGWQFFIMLNVPIYNFGLHSDYIEAAGERLAALKSAESAVKLSVKKRLARDYGLAEISKKRLLGAKILAKKSREVFKMTEEGYLAGALNALELQEAQNNEIKSRIALAKAINGFYLNIAQLDIDMGTIPSGGGKL